MERRLRPAAPEKGTPLAHVLRAHEQFHARGTLRDNLGDGFLYAFNPVFRAVRDQALRLGARFVDDPRSDYHAFPLMALDDALDARRLPYLRNAPWVKRLAPRFTLPELKKSELKFNYLFHESAHLIAHHAFFGRRRVATLPKNEATLLATLAGEAFANTVECLATCFAEGEIGSFFLDANCHFRANEREVALLLRSARRFGWPAVSRVLLFSFLHSNYLYETLTAAQLARVNELAGLPRKARTGSLARIGLQLNVRFRTVTTPLHLRKCGFEPKALTRLLRADPGKLLLEPRHRRIRHTAGQLALLATSGIPS